MDQDGSADWLHRNHRNAMIKVIATFIKKRNSNDHIYSRYTI
jgi:hypothetical protein